MNGGKEGRVKLTDAKLWRLKPSDTAGKVLARDGIVTMPVHLVDPRVRTCDGLGRVRQLVVDAAVELNQAAG